VPCTPVCVPRSSFFACSGSVCWSGFGWLTGAQPCAGSGLAGSCLELGRLALAWRGAEVWLASEGRLGGQIVLRSVACAAGLSGRSICSLGGAGIASYCMVGMAVAGGAGGAAGVGFRGVSGLVWPIVRSSGRLGGIMAGAGGAGCLAGDGFCCRAEMTLQGIASNKN
jgi:hypothetical protein